MTAKEAIANLRATGADDPVEYFLYLANHVHEARLTNGSRLNDAIDIALWLTELAEAIRVPSLDLAEIESKRRADLTCPRCGHIHEGDRECGAFIGGGRICRCEMEVSA
jgi:hypothetical protein